MGSAFQNVDNSDLPEDIAPAWCLLPGMPIEFWKHSLTKEDNIRIGIEDVGYRTFRKTSMAYAVCCQEWLAILGDTASRRRIIQGSAFLNVDSCELSKDVYAMC